MKRRTWFDLDRLLGDRAPMPRGIFELNVYRRGQLILHEEDRNLVVNGIKDPLAHLIGDGTAAKIVTQIAFGSSGVAAAVTDTYPLTTQYIRAIGGRSYPVAGTVAFAWSLDAGEANGLAIREWGLVTTGNALIARKVRASAILKEADVTLDGSWKLVW